MGLGVVVLLIGIPLGVLMLFKLRSEANKPSRIAYALGGIGCLAGTLVLAGLAFTKPADDDASSRSPTTLDTPTYPSLTFKPPMAPFVVPGVMVRGSLEMIGYMTSPGPDGGLVATVYFWAPEVTSKAPEDDPAAPPPCELAPRVTGAGTDHVVVDVDLVWTPNTSKSVLMNGDCRADGGKHPVQRSYVVGPVSSSARLFTSKPEADTPLSRLTEAPR